MSLGPTPADHLARVLTDLRIGLPVVLRSPDGPALVLAAETATADRLAALRAHGSPVLAITAWRAKTLKARAYDDDLARLTIPADAGLPWLRAATDPAAALENPLAGPFTSERDGPADLHRTALRLTKAARLLPAALVVAVKEAPSDLTELDASDTDAALAKPAALSKIVHGRVPTRFADHGRVHVFRETHGTEEHYAVEIGRPDRTGPILVRLHSACFTGDVLGSLKCDCGPQLHGALDRMGEEGAGILLYLNQEGRGIGLANKMRAYSLQDQGFDTVEANHRLGFEDDERDFRTGAAILRLLGVSHVRLMTNNPAKVAMLEVSSLTVTERVPLAVGRTEDNASYLDVKAKKSGHLL